MFDLNKKKNLNIQACELKQKHLKVPAKLTPLVLKVNRGLLGYEWREIKFFIEKWYNRTNIFHTYTSFQMLSFLSCRRQPASTLLTIHGCISELQASHDTNCNLINDDGKIFQMCNWNLILGKVYDIFCERNFGDDLNKKKIERNWKD